jgi:hypothetical protein
MGWIDTNLAQNTKQDVIGSIKRQLQKSVIADRAMGYFPCWNGT